MNEEREYSEFLCKPAENYEYFMVEGRKIPEFYRDFANLKIWAPFYTTPRIKNGEPETDPRDGTVKMNKIPLNASLKNKKDGNVSDPKAWVTLSEALVYLDKHKNDKDRPAEGVGILLRDPLTSIDLDHVINPVTHEIEKEADQVLNSLQTYTEFSVSGTGTHSFCEFPGLPQEWRKKGHASGPLQDRIELYQTSLSVDGTYKNGRFYAVTFIPVEGYQNYDNSTSIKRRRIPELTQVYNSYFQGSESTEVGFQDSGKFRKEYSGERPRQKAYTDEEVIEILKRTNGERFTSVYNLIDAGDRENQSDQSLCNFLAWVTMDPEQIKRIWLESPRGTRSKPHEREDYVIRTIGKALASDQAGRYDPDHNTEFSDKSEKTRGFNLPREGRETLQDLNGFVLDGKVLHVYDDEKGYISDPEIIERLIAKRYNGNLIPSRVRNIRLHMAQNATEKKESPARYIEFQNGILDVKTMEFAPRTPEYFIRNVIPWNYNPEAERVPFVDETLKQWACNDPELVELMIEWAGYNLYRACPIHSFMLLIGKRRNGKSVYCDLLREMLGVKNTCSIPLADLDRDPHSTANLYGKMANIADENKGTYMPESPALKQLSAGGYISANQKLEKRFEYRNYSKQTFSFNEDYRMDDRSGALKERTLVLPFNADFSDPDKQNPMLLAQLTEEKSMEYFISLAVKGLMRVLTQGRFTRPRKAAVWIERQDILNNPIKQFIMDVNEGFEFNDPDFFGQVTDITDPNFFTEYPTKTVFRCYSDWCKENGLHPVASSKLSQILCSELGLEIKVKKDKDRKSIKYYVKKAG